MDRKLERAHQRLTDRVMGRPGVSGTAIGERGGKPCLKVYVSDTGAKKTIPRSQDGFPVVVEVSGRFKAL
ncbi:MAG: hypothetical protein PVJ04_06360 [Gemmatimonadota bacterium]